MAPKKKPVPPPSKKGKGRGYQKPTLTKHGPLDADVAAFSALY